MTGDAFNSIGQSLSWEANGNSTDQESQSYRSEKFTSAFI